MNKAGGEFHKLSLRLLTEGCLMSTYGSDEPDTLRCHPTFVYRFFCLFENRDKLQAHIEAVRCFHGDKAKYSAFMSACLEPDSSMDRNKVRFEHSFHPQAEDRDKFNVEVSFADEA